MSVVDARMRHLLGDGPVAQAALYHLDSGGGKVRAQLGLDAGAALGLPQDASVCCACAAELLHNASLIHDDLQENDLLRRGRPAVWHKYGIPAAVCTGDLMISAAFASLIPHPHVAAALTIMHDAIARTANGQVDDFQNRAKSIDDYRAVVAGKTGPLLALPVRLALCAAGVRNDTTATAIGDHFAFAYQALDDLADREQDEAAGRLNICLILKAGGASQAQAEQIIRRETRSALAEVRALSGTLPLNCGAAFRHIADRLDSAFMEYSDAA